MTEIPDGLGRCLLLASVFVVTVALLTGTGTVAAQSAPTEEFNVTFGGEDRDSAFSMVETSDGGFALAGATESFGTGGQNVWLIKTDSDGNEQFSETYGEGAATSVVETSDGGYALAVAVTTGVPDSVNTDPRLIKTDEDGNEEINKTYSGSDNDNPASVVETSDGGYAIVGRTGSLRNSLGDSDADAWLIKTDANGNEEFKKTYGGEDFDIAGSVVQTSDEGFALAGGTRSFGVGRSDWYAWLIKTDANGNEEFNETYSEGALSSMIETSDGGYALAGAKSFETRDSSSGEALLVKTDANGNEEFSETYVEGSPSSVAETSDGGYALAGTKLPDTRDSTDNDDFLINTDALLIKTDEDGNEEFNETFGGEERDFAVSVVQTSDGGLVLGGGTESFGEGSNDAWLLKLSGGRGEGQRLPGFTVVTAVLALLIVVGAAVRQRAE